MEQRIFKDWVVILLMIINVISIIFMASDFDNMFTFWLVHIIALLIFIINSILISKYGKKFIN